MRLKFFLVFQAASEAKIPLHAALRETPVSLLSGIHTVFCASYKSNGALAIALWAVPTATFNPG